MFRLQLPKGIGKLNLIAPAVSCHCLVAVLDEVMHRWYPVFCGAAALRKCALYFQKKRLKGKEGKKKKSIFQLNERQGNDEMGDMFLLLPS